MIQQARIDYAALADEHAALQKASRQIEESVMTMIVRRFLDRADLRRNSMRPSLEMCARTPISGRVITTPLWLKSPHLKFIAREWPRSAMRS
jgi:hypothetical protein